MNNPIPRSGLWATPESFDDLLARVESCTSPYDAMMLAVNLCHKVVNEEMIEQPAKAELEVREVFLPDGEKYFSLFDKSGDKVAPWADSDSIEELLQCLACKPE